MTVKTHSSVFSLFSRVRDSTWIGGYGGSKGGGDRALVCMARKKSAGDPGEAELKGKRVFVRADLNVPIFLYVAMDGKKEEKEAALNVNEGSLHVGYPEVSEYLAHSGWAHS